MPRKKISIVVPVYYNAGSLPALYERVSAVERQLNEKGFDMELIFVDDGSGDNSLEELLKIKEKRNETKIVKLVRNFGAIQALKTGASFSTGDCFVILAADLQAPPELIPDLVERWMAGSKFVVCVRKKRHDPLLSNVFSKLYYIFVRYFVMTGYPQTGYDMSLMDKVIQPYFSNCGKNVYALIYVFWLGYKPEYIYYDRAKREHGKSRWTMRKKITAFLDTILGFSIVPIRAMLALGLIVSCSSLLYGAVIVAYRLCGYREMPGFPSLAALISFLLGIIIFMLGIIGEYIWRIYDEVGKRPEVIIDEVL